MIDLDWVNRQTYYQVYAENSSAFRFRTRAGRLYELCFVRMLRIGSHSMVYSFLNLEEGKTKGTADLEASRVFALLIHAYLLSHPEDMVYFCHRGQVQDSKYAKLFLRWGVRYMDSVGYPAEVITGHGGTKPDEYRHYVVFVLKNCNQLDSLRKVLLTQGDQIVDYHVEQRYMDLNN